MKNREAVRALNLFLRRHGWRFEPRPQPRWRHPRLAAPWPTPDALRLTREAIDGEPEAVRCLGHLKAEELGFREVPR